MRTTNVIKGQSLLDIAIEKYGNEDAVIELLELNPSLPTFRQRTETDGMMISIIIEDIVCQISDELPEGWPIVYNENSPLVSTLVLKKMPSSPIITTRPVRWLHELTLQYLDNVNRVGGRILYNDILAVDRLVRDFKGEPNPFFETIDMYGDTHFFMPHAGADRRTKAVNLNEFRINWVGGDFLKPYYLPTDKLNYLKVHDLYKIDGDPHHITFDNATVVCAQLDSTPGYLMGGFESTDQKKGIGLWTDVNGAYYTSQGTFDGQYVHHYGWTSKPGVFIGCTGLGRQRLYFDGEYLAQDGVNGGYVPLPVSLYIGTIKQLSLGDESSRKLGFTAYIRNVNQDAGKIKFITNAVNFYLYNRGIYKTFKPIL